MIPAHSVLTFALAALGLMLIPGPSVLFVNVRSLACPLVRGQLRRLVRGRNL